MPLYQFRCGKCGAEQTRSMSVEDRDTEVVWCEREDCRPVNSHPVRMDRIPTTATFSVTGFNAANGYTRKDG